MRVSREQVLAFRMCVQQLNGSTPTVTETEILDLGVQDTGTDGGRWALALRGAPVTAASDLTADLVLAWTLRGAPHFYRRAEAAAVAAATAPAVGGRRRQADLRRLQATARSGHRR